jgi:hypothetical protein
VHEYHAHAPNCRRHPHGDVLDTRWSCRASPENRLPYTVGCEGLSALGVRSIRIFELHKCTVDARVDSVEPRCPHDNAFDDGPDSQRNLCPLHRARRDNHGVPDSRGIPPMHHEHTQSAHRISSLSTKNQIVIFVCEHYSETHQYPLSTSMLFAFPSTMFWLVSPAE